MEIKQVTGKSGAVFEDALAIRLAVFVREQGVPEALEKDSDDAIATHYVGYVAGQPVVTLRTVLTNQRLHIQRVATIQSARHHGYAATLMTHVLDQAQADDHVQSAYLGAQLTALGFYDRLGFTPHGDVFEEAGIMHRQMVKSLK
ncbi:MAG: GNAT family N-acetyltransferase [Lactobacillus sp.]|nr:MAG: GNAT family N-acetyltransferase [Lactobacillus sp.]